MYTLQELAPGCHRLCIPFEDLYTTVYILRTEAGTALVDAATNAQDVRDAILPALDSLGIGGADVRLLLASHRHSDHFGGMAALQEALPGASLGMISPAEGSCACRLRDGDILLGCIRVLHLPGHTDDMAAFLDLRHGLLLSADALQLEGIGRYGCGLDDAGAYRRSITRLRSMDIGQIAAAHDYRPLGFRAGEGKAGAYLDACEAYLDRLTRFAAENPGQTAEGIADAYNARWTPEGYPPVPAHTFAGILRTECGCCMLRGSCGRGEEENALYRRKPKNMG